MKKGQAAMEFLMTYGWAILVVIAAIAALAYFGVLDPARLLPERCQSSAGMDCIDKASIRATQIDFSLKNNIGFNAIVTDASITGTGTSATLACTTADVASGTGGIYTDPTTNVSVPNNQVIKVRFTGCTGINANDKFQGLATVSYVNQESGQTHPITIEIRGSVAP